MSDPIEIQKVKLNTLIKLFTELGYQTSSKIGENEISLFLNKQSKTGRFDPILTEKLFQVLSLDDISSTMKIEEFIKEFLEFEDNIKKNAELFSIKLAQEKEIYDNILKQCRIYQSEKLNAEGFCENAKIYGEITDVNIKEKLEGINEIIILIIYNDKKEKLCFRIGDKNSSEMLKKSFSFKPTSRKDNFEFIMKGVNENNQIFDIGSKVFPLNNISSQEEYLVQIIIPEIDNPNKIVANINARIVLYMSDFKYYESLRKKQEKRLKKFMAAANKAAEYLKCVREIYGDLSEMKPEITVNYNNEKLMKRKGVKLNVDFNNIAETKTSGSKFYVEYKNEREVPKKEIPIKVEFNNSKEIIQPVTKTQNYEYQYNYTSNINQNIIDNIEKKIEILNNDKENIMNSLQNIPKQNIQNISITNIQTISQPIIEDVPITNIQNIQKPNIEQVNIKRTTENIIIKNKEQPKIAENKEIPRFINQNQIFNENIIQEQIKSKQIIPNKVTQPRSEPIILPTKENSQIFQKIEQTTTETETKTQNISNPQYTLNKQTINETKFDIDSFLKQTTTKSETQTQKQTNQIQVQAQTQSKNQIKNPAQFLPENQIYLLQTQDQNQTLAQLNTKAQTQKQTQLQTKIQTQTQTQSENENIFPPQISYINTSQNNNNISANSHIHQKAETKKIIQITPKFSQNQCQSKNININKNTLIKSVNSENRSHAYSNSALIGQNVNQYLNNSNKKTTKTKNINSQQNKNLYKSANIKTISNNMSVNDRNFDINTQQQNEQNIEYARASIRKIIGDILKEKTKTAETKFLAPIINKVQINSSCNNAILSEMNTKMFVSEKTLPTSYLPEKVNKIIFDENITTLPVIRTKSPPTFQVLKPIIRKPEIIYKGEENIFDHDNIMQNNSSSNNKFVNNIKVIDNKSINNLTNHININNSNNNIVNNVRISHSNNNIVNNNISDNNIKIINNNFNPNSIENINENNFNFNNNTIENINGNNFNFFDNNNYINNISDNKIVENNINNNVVNVNYSTFNSGNNYFTPQATETKITHISQVHPNLNINIE